MPTNTHHPAGVGTWMVVLKYSVLPKVTRLLGGMSDFWSGGETVKEPGISVIADDKGAMFTDPRTNSDWERHGSFAKDSNNSSITLNC